MAIAIIVEDGTGKSDANSYVSVADASSYAEARGVAFEVNGVAASEDQIATMLIRATDYLEAQDCRYIGVRATAEQALAWPRKGASMNCQAIPENVIPRSLISAQIQLAMAINAGFDLQPNVSPQDYVTEETVGPITTKYSDPAAIGVQPTFTAVNALLAPLFGSCYGTRLRTVRI